MTKQGAFYWIKVHFELVSSPRFHVGTAPKTPRFDWLPNNGHTVLPEATFRPKNWNFQAFVRKKSGVLGLSTVIFWKTCKLSNIKIKKNTRCFSSPSWRSLNHWKGSLNHPEKVAKNCQAGDSIRDPTNDPLIEGRLTCVKGVTFSPPQKGHFESPGGWCLLNAVSESWKTSYQLEQKLVPGTIFQWV